MVKIVSGALGGPKYMTNLKMVFPVVNMIPSGVPAFMDFDKIEKEGLISVTNQVAKIIKIIKEAKQDLPIIP